MKILIFSIVCITLFTPACSLQEKDESGRASKSPETIPKMLIVSTEADIKSRLHEGMTRQEIEHLFGEPHIVSTNQDKSIIMHYYVNLSQLVLSATNDFAGFTVLLKDGKMVEYSPIRRLTSNTAKISHPRGEEESKSSENEVIKDGALLSFYICRRNLTNALNMPLTQLKEGQYIANTPELTVRRFTIRKSNQQDVDSNSGETSTGAAVNVELQEGADDFFELTQKNVGKRMLMVLDNDIVSVALIQEPIPKGRLHITVKNPDSLKPFFMKDEGK